MLHYDSTILITIEYDVTNASTNTGRHCLAELDLLNISFIPAPTRAAKIKVSK